VGDPFANLPAAADAADVADLVATCGGLAEPFDGVPAFDAADSEVDTKIGLAADQAFTRTATRRLFVDYRADPDAYRHLAELPGPGASLHGVIGGRYAQWDMVPALVERTGEPIAELLISTLSYSRANAADVLGMIDGGQIGHVTLLVSCYFKAQNRDLYDALVPALIARDMPVMAIRTHCKILLMRMAGGACYVCEGSANLRSGKSLEQFVLTRCPDLYAFHRRWMVDELVAKRRGAA
jgi:hypothetical protein